MAFNKSPLSALLRTNGVSFDFSFVAVSRVGLIDRRLRQLEPGLSGVVFCPDRKLAETRRRSETNPKIVYRDAFVVADDTIVTVALTEPAEEKWLRRSSLGEVEFPGPTRLDAFLPTGEEEWSEFCVTLSDEPSLKCDVLLLDAGRYSLDALRGAGQLLERERPSMIGITLSIEQAIAELAAPSAFLRERGYVPLDLETKRFSRAALPRPMIAGGAGETFFGPLGQLTLWFALDLASHDLGAQGPYGATSVERILRLATLYDVFDLPDCAAELFISAAADADTGPQQDWEQLLSVVTPAGDYGKTEYSSYLEAAGREARRGGRSIAGNGGGLNYPIGDFVLHGGADMGEVAPGLLRIQTPEAPWAYAVTCPPYHQEGAGEGVAILDIPLSNVHGEISIAVENIDGDDVIAERTISDSDAFTVISILARRTRDCGRLVIRNAAEGGKGGWVEVGQPLVRIIDPVRVQPNAARGSFTGDWSRYYGDYAATIPEQLRARRFAELQQETPYEWRPGLRVNLIPQNELSRALYVSGEYEPETLQFLERTLLTGDCVIDLGANTGVISLFAARLVGASGRVYAFEPSSREFSRLEANLALNAFENVSPVRAAVGKGKRKTAKLHVARDAHAGQNTLGRDFAYENVASGVVEEVPYTTLDRFAEETGIARVAAIKIDIEGGEYAALVGGAETIDRDRPVIVTELFAAALASSGASIDDVWSFLKERDYQFFGWSSSGGVCPLDTPPGDSTNILAAPREDLSLHRRILGS